MRRLVAFALAAALVVSCSSSDDTATDTTTTDTTTAAPTTTAAAGGDPLAGRPFDVFVPTTYSAATAMPLVVLLHGFGASGILQNLYFGLQPLAESRGFLYVYPDGTTNAIDRQFWNATDACCGFGSTVDDVAYLTALVEDVKSNYTVDPKQIYFVGHSNGGFMSYRMACDRADVVAAIVSLAGATWEDNTKCDPSEPVSVLQIHGTDDETIVFDGGVIDVEAVLASEIDLGNIDLADITVGEHPGAQATAAIWAGNNGCTGPLIELPTPLDLDASIAGDETTAAEYGSCPVAGAVQLWVVPDASHVPPLSSTFAADVVDFLFAHPKA